MTWHLSGSGLLQFMQSIRVACVLWGTQDSDSLLFNEGKTPDMIGSPGYTSTLISDPGEQELPPGSFAVTLPSPKVTNLCTRPLKWNNRGLLLDWWAAGQILRHKFNLSASLYSQEKKADRESRLTKTVNNGGRLTSSLWPLTEWKWNWHTEYVLTFIISVIITLLWEEAYWVERLGSNRYLKKNESHIVMNPQRHWKVGGDRIQN